MQWRFVLCYTINCISMRLRWYLGDCRGAERHAALKEKKIDYHNHLYYDLDAPSWMIMRTMR